MMTRSLFLSSTALVSGLIYSSFAFSADLYVGGEPNIPVVLPAVSGLNGKISAQGGSFSDEGFGTVTGSVSVPIGHRYGLQLDGMAGARDGDFVGGGAAHLFWRDPTIGLLGVYGSFIQREDFDGHVAKIGLEGEYYWNNFTVKALIGAEDYDVGSGFTDPDGDLFTSATVSYYLNENLELSIGHRYTADRNALALGVEYQLDQTFVSSGVSLFAEARIGEDDYEGVWGGVRFYLGDEKSLMRRHREDDPDFEEDLVDVMAKPVSSSTTIMAITDGDSDGGG